VRFWKQRGLQPPEVDVLSIITERAVRYYSQEPRSPGGRIYLADSRNAAILKQASAQGRFSWVITSPPYYGMRSYLPDQWLRLWFLGGPAEVVYRSPQQLQHTGADTFAGQLRQVWCNLIPVCEPEATLVIRFGGIRDREVDPLELLRTSLQGSGWELVRVDSAGSAELGRRQALHFRERPGKTIEEYDVWAVQQKG
jgi:hypothetical protein